MNRDFRTVTALIAGTVFLMVFCYNTDDSELQDISDIEADSEAPAVTENNCSCHDRAETPEAAAASAAANITLRNTTCGLGAFSRGPHQRVVSFTFYEAGDSAEVGAKSEVSRQYFRGIRANLALVRAHYPGFVMRLYYEVSPETEVKLCNLACSETELDLCPATKLPLFGNTTSVYPLIWRFLPAIDPQVDIFFSRDLDSRISAREAAAVREFLQSQSQVHVMRDHPAHSAPMMGGMWGARMDTAAARGSFKEAFKKMLRNGVSYVNRTLGGWDQIALQRYVWPWAKKVSYSHDSYNCKRFSYCHAFPTKRLLGAGNYVGSIEALNASVSTPCPYKCRPRDHKDWDLC